MSNTTATETITRLITTTLLRDTFTSTSAITPKQSLLNPRTPSSSPGDNEKFSLSKLAKACLASGLIIFVVLAALAVYFFIRLRSHKRTRKLKAEAEAASRDSMIMVPFAAIQSDDHRQESFGGTFFSKDEEKGRSRVGVAGAGKD
ncbi:hypothetical protein F5Y16DRAFT_399482 [Xylariaceae sp. FL0255]|nr:hypothetical protein F5Y16DRAFT_399482 [Xylariaceae sp. FL0255]